MQQLFSEFKPATAADWKAQLIKDLKGEAFETLVWKNENGLDIQPFYTAEDLQHAYEPAFSHSDWDICVTGKAAGAKALNAQLLRNLDAGATSISLSCKGLDLEQALEGVQLNYIHSTFYANTKEALALKAFFDKHYPAKELNCSVFPESFATENDLLDWKQAVTAFKGYAGVKTCCMDVLPHHNKNSFAYYEVALAMAGLNEYLSAYTDQDQPLQVTVKAGASADYFIQIAKLRAIHRLWKVIAADGKLPAKLHLVVETSSTNKSISDSYNNLLRTTVEAMAAVAGGCNELIVTEFDLFFPANKSLAGRMAINQQLILKEESYFDKIADVACGSYYLESMTDAIAAKALEAVKQIERQGGYFKCLAGGSIAAELEQQARQRAAAIEAQQQLVIGVNKFRNEKEDIRLTTDDLSRLESLPLNNPVLNFELGHYFKHHA